ncbi:hypothetical protein MtrunA17_Chr7g0238971 [Medicago truncatula]|uniref:DUF674 family protein n=1 Tax=Medicago truncatula TaxID=3880 RepID=A0A072U0J4_MEDTR|nr:uncharacterized protein LOC25498508 [Medicago truncatula]KEH22916.1 DUF674 family protein [Medicago truncatula]RHN46138.1 hypothetical protein MtrunA17_Chr7g0238971 [Medicago truncatula]
MAATTSTQAEEHVSLKLLLNENGNKVLFAEAGKDFVDILCSFLTMPLGTIARLVEKESSIGQVTVGCLNSLYKSVADLDEGCVSNETIKQMLLQPINSAEDYCNTLKINIDDTQPTKYFTCATYSIGCLYRNITNSTYKDKHKCHCGNSFTHPIILTRLPQGFVNDVATFVITDDLTIKPNCIDYTSFSLFEEFGIKNPSSVKEVVLNFTKEKVLDLLKCSLLSKSTLTDLFLEKKPSLERSRFILCDVEISDNIQINLKLVIRKSDNKVLYAQGQQDFANLLLSFLTFPLGGIVRIFGENCSFGSMNGLYKSIVDLDENQYLTSMEAKNRLVDPCISPQLKLSKSILPILKPGVHKYYGYVESNSIIHVQIFKTDVDKTICAGSITELNLRYGVNPGEDYVKGPAMYFATDDLVNVAPLTPISALGLLNRLKTPLNDLKEKVVTIGTKECLSILKAALTSTSALTNGLAHM